MRICFILKRCVLSIKMIQVLCIGLMPRIVAGRYKNRLIGSIESIRPTKSIVREAIFSMISSRFDIDGVNVLDLYSGSGALGFEAMSRGAEKCIFVDTDSNCLSEIRSSAERIGILDKITTRLADARNWKSKVNHDLVFLDPPYKNGYVNATLRVIARRFKSDSIVVCESHIHEEIDLDGYELICDRSYGSTKVHILRFNYARQDSNVDIANILVNKLSNVSVKISQPNSGDEIFIHVRSMLFNDISMVEQHRMIYDALSNDMKGRLHLIKLTTEGE